MLKVKATKTGRYAQKDPGAPQYYLIKGNVYDVPDELAQTIESLSGCEILIPEEEYVPKEEKPEVKEPQADPMAIETKEQPKRTRTVNRKNK